MHPSWQRAVILLFSAATLGGAVTSLSAGETRASDRSRELYRVYIQASRTSDHVPLLAASVAVRLRQRTIARLPTEPPAENRPAFPAVTLALNRTAKPGEYELVTVLALREIRRNRKGQIKRNRRNLGSLLPIRLGETQTASVPDDAVTVEVRAARD